MEESGYNPGILGGKGTVSLLASPGQIHKKDDKDSPSIFKKEAETVLTCFKLLHNAGYMLNYLVTNPVYISNKGLLIT